MHKAALNVINLYPRLQSNLNPLPFFFNYCLYVNFYFPSPRHALWSLDLCLLSLIFLFSFDCYTNMNSLYVTISTLLIFSLCYDQTFSTGLFSNTFKVCRLFRMRYLVLQLIKEQVILHFYTLNFCYGVTYFKL